METTSRANQVVPVSASSTDERAAFITKTYMHLLGAIAAFTALEIAFFQTGLALKITNLLMGSRYGWLLALGAFMLVGTMGSSMARKAASPGSQYAGLGIYVVAEAIIFAPLLYLANFYSGAEIIANAAAVTMIGFCGLTAIAFTSRRDFTGLGPYLKWFGFCALGFIVVSVSADFELGVLFSTVMVVFAGAYILHQTSKIMRHYPTTHHVSASLELFASVALMFWYVLRILMSLSRD